jgi:hypothetical protein
MVNVEGKCKINKELLKFRKVENHLLNLSLPNIETAKAILHEETGIKHKK